MSESHYTLKAPFTVSIHNGSEKSNNNIENSQKVTINDNNVLDKDVKNSYPVDETQRISKQDSILTNKEYIEKVQNTNANK